jgi:hypothetical protein
MALMKIYVGFDDTDTQASACGTGKLTRRFQKELPESCRSVGVVRQQLFVHAKIPYTSHNSSACMIIIVPDADLLPAVIDRAVAHIRNHAIEGSDPGLCVATQSEAASHALIDFGYFCTRATATQKQAMEAAHKTHLSAHGGSSDGIIGAAAAVGLTACGWNGRFIEYGDLRGFPDEVPVAHLNQAGIRVVSAGRDAQIPAPEDRVATNGWLRPRLFGQQPVLLVNPQGKGRWQNIYRKRKRGKNGNQNIRS